MAESPVVVDGNTLRWRFGTAPMEMPGPALDWLIRGLMEVHSSQWTLAAQAWMEGPCAKKFLPEEVDLMVRLACMHARRRLTGRTDV